MYFFYGSFQEQKISHHRRFYPEYFRDAVQQKVEPFCHLSAEQSVGPEFREIKALLKP